MKITAGTLSLAFAVFLDFIELISSMDPVERPLAQLFPGYTDGSILPHIKVFPYKTATRNSHFHQIGIMYMNLPSSAILAMDHVIVAWRGSDSYSNNRRGDYIQPLWKLFPVRDEKCWVFDTRDNQWVTLHENEFKKLGFGNVLRLVELQQNIADTYSRSTGTPEIDQQAHYYAYNVANHAVNNIQSSLAANRSPDVSDRQRLIRETYEQAYDHAFDQKVNELRLGHLSLGPH